MAVKNPLEDTYKIWPFRSDFEDGRTNIGAIDLTKEPERIKDIHELSQTPKLKDAIYNLNKEASALMTLGCLIEKDPDQDVVWSYLQFCFRPEIDVSSIELRKIDELFFKYVAEKNDEAVAKHLAGYLLWEAFEIELYGNTPVLAYSVYYPHQNFADVEMMHLYLLKWLRQNFDHLAS
ncbi:hypothetical protein [Acinetobacter ursingii]|uniref:hypothetical protein n=1 Tax=Acinetobacter ursingii TaxID=108980 RepID=UPI003AF71CD8